MTESSLRPCQACARHARVTEVACPFCGVAFAETFRASSQPPGPSARLSRAALFAFAALGTGTLALAPGCDTSLHPMYGLPPMRDDASDDVNRVVGDAAPVDADADAPAAEPDDAAPMPGDASQDQVTFLPPYGIAPAYGLPPGT